MLDDQVRVGDIEVEEFARGKLVVEPIDCAVLEIGERIMFRGAGQLVFTEDRLLEPGGGLIGGIFGRLAVYPIAALDRLAAITPRGNAAGVVDLAFYMKTRDEKAVAVVLR